MHDNTTPTSQGQRDWQPSNAMRRWRSSHAAATVPVTPAFYQGDGSRCLVRRTVSVLTMAGLVLSALPAVVGEYVEEVSDDPEVLVFVPGADGYDWSQRTENAHVVWDVSQPEDFVLVTDGALTDLVDLDVTHLDLPENTTVSLSAVPDHGLAMSASSADDYAAGTEGIVHSTGAVLWNLQLPDRSVLSHLSHYELVAGTEVLGTLWIAGGHPETCVGKTCVSVKAADGAKARALGAATPAGPSTSSWAYGRVTVQAVRSVSDYVLASTQSCFTHQMKIMVKVEGGGQAGAKTAAGVDYSHKTRTCSALNVGGAGVKTSQRQQKEKFQQDVYSDGSKRTFSVGAYQTFYTTSWDGHYHCKDGTANCFRQEFVEAGQHPTFTIEETISKGATMSVGWSVPGFGGVTGTISAQATEKNTITISVQARSQDAWYYIGRLGAVGDEGGMYVSVQEDAYCTGPC